MTPYAREYLRRLGVTEPGEDAANWLRRAIMADVREKLNKTIAWEEVETLSLLCHECATDVRKCGGRVLAIAVQAGVHQCAYCHITIDHPQ